MSSPAFGDPVELSPEQIEWYRAVLAEHRDDPVDRVCPRCRGRRCAQYRSAWVQLVCSGAEFNP